MPAEAAAALHLGAYVKTRRAGITFTAGWSALQCRTKEEGAAGGGGGSSHCHHRAKLQYCIEYRPPHLFPSKAAPNKECATLCYLFTDALMEHYAHSRAETRMQQSYSSTQASLPHPPSPRSNPKPVKPTRSTSFSLSPTRNSHSLTVRMQTHIKITCS